MFSFFIILYLQLILGLSSEKQAYGYNMIP